MRTLHETLMRVDCSRTEDLKLLAATLVESPGSIARLVTEVEKHPDQPSAVSATWVILALCRDGGSASIDTRLAVRLGQLLAKATHWQTRLHLLQTLELIEVSALLPKPQLCALANAAIAGAEDPKPFVRAWSINLLGRIGEALPARLRQRAADAIAYARTRGPASVRARVRDLSRRGALEWMGG